MWKRGGRSSALDRAQALLSAKKSGRGDASAESTDTARTHAGAMGGKTRSEPQKGHTVFSDLSDLSPVSSAPENGADAVLPAASGNSLRREGGSTEGLRPQSSLGGGGGGGGGGGVGVVGGGSRFLKKAPPPATISNHSPVSRYVSSSQSGSQTAAMSRLKNTAAVGDRSRSRAAGAGAGAGAALSLAGLETRSTRVVSAVSLESDEEDMRKLLGDSLDSTDSSLVKVARPSSAAHKMLSKGNQRVHFTPPPAAISPSPPSNTALPRSPASPSRRSSPFRFTGQVQAQFSPSVLSPAPSSSPHVSPSPQRPNSAGRPGSPHRSLSSLSGHSEVLSLEELFPQEPGSAHVHSNLSSVSSEDFKINVMSLDDLVPAAFGFTEETQRKEREAKHSVSDRHQQPPRLREEEAEEEGDLLDYQSDFESVSRSEMNHSASQVSEHLQGDGDDAAEVVMSEVGEEVSTSDASRQRTEDDYSSSFSDTTSRISVRSRASKSVSRSGDCKSSVSHQWRRASARKVLKEAAVQTQPNTMTHTWSAGTATFDPMTYVDPIPVAAYTLNAETVEALSTYNPAAFVLNEMLKQQLAMTRRFIESSRQLHSSLVRSLEPPDYRYTTLEGTREKIRKPRSHKLTMEEALEEVQREMRDCV